MSPRLSPTCGGSGLRVVVDANVWVSGLIAPSGPPGAVLAAVREGRLQPIVSWDLVEEIVDVLGRPRIRRYGVTDDDVAELVSLLGPLLPRIVVDVPIRDEDDAPVVATALAGRAKAIIAGDRDFLDDADLRAWLSERGIAVLAPAEVLAR